MNKTKPNKSWKQKLLHELSEYWINFLYMGLFFSAIIFYRRQVLMEYNIQLDDYFLGLIKAAVIAKVVMIAGFFPFVKKFDGKALIVPVLFKAVVFTLWVMLFDLLEEGIKAAISNPEMSEVWVELQSRISPVWFSSSILILLCFIPFFAFKEMVRIVGGERIRNLFLHKRES